MPSAESAKEQQRPEETAEDEHDDDNGDDASASTTVFVLALSLLGLLGQGRRIAAQNTQKRRCPDKNAGVEIALPKFGQDEIPDDQPALCIGEPTLQAVADLLNPHIAFVRRYQQQCTVVLTLLSDPPGAAQLIAKVVDGIALK